MVTNKLKQLNSFLEDVNKNLNEIPEEVPGEQVSEPTYVTPSIEIKLSKEKRQACRDILLEIRNFGVSQRQIMFLIYLLALDLEDSGVMNALVNAVNENRDLVPLTKEDTAKPVEKAVKKKLIVS